MPFFQHPDSHTTELANRTARRAFVPPLRLIVALMLSLLVAHLLTKLFVHTLPITAHLLLLLESVLLLAIVLPVLYLLVLR